MILAISALLIFAGAQATNVAVIDLDKILKRYSLVQSINEHLRSQFDTQGKKLAAEQQAIEAKIASLQRNSSVMTERQRGDLQAEISTQKNNLKLEQGRFDQDLQDAQNSAMQQVLAKVNQAVIQVAKNKSYDVILEKDKTVYITEQIDISDQVLAVLNKTQDKK